MFGAVLSVIVVLLFAASYRSLGPGWTEGYRNRHSYQDRIRDLRRDVLLGEELSDSLADDTDTTMSQIYKRKKNGGTVLSDRTEDRRGWRHNGTPHWNGWRDSTCDDSDYGRGGYGRGGYGRGGRSLLGSYGLPSEYDSIYLEEPSVYRNYDYSHDVEEISRPLSGVKKDIKDDLKAYVDDQLEAGRAAAPQWEAATPSQWAAEPRAGKAFGAEYVPRDVVRSDTDFARRGAAESAAGSAAGSAAESAAESAARGSPLGLGRASALADDSRRADDRYILKSQIVPPVCPACPTAVAREKECPPCPACDRCPEPNVECKRVTSYGGASDQAFPVPVLNDFSQFGM